MLRWLMVGMLIASVGEAKEPVLSASEIDSLKQNREAHYAILQVLDVSMRIAGTEDETTDLTVSVKQQLRGVPIDKMWSHSSKTSRYRKHGRYLLGWIAGRGGAQVVWRKEVPAGRDREYATAVQSIISIDHD